MVLAKNLIDYFFPLYPLAFQYCSILILSLLYPYIQLPHFQILLEYLNPLPPHRFLIIIHLHLIKPLRLIYILAHNHLITRILLTKYLSASSFLIENRLFEAINTIGQNSFLRHLNYN